GVLDNEGAFFGSATNHPVIFRVNNANELNLTSSAFYPSSNDGNALGTTTNMWSDLFVASGGVISWNNALSLTHSTNLLTLSGGGLALSGVVGIDYNPGSDIDTDIITVGVSGAPRIFWDESQDRF